MNIARLIRKLICRLSGLHSWTSKSLRDEPIGKLTGDYFLDYAKIKEHAFMYCEHCGKPSSLNDTI